jgi:hypothetical protein
VGDAGAWFIQWRTRGKSGQFNAPPEMDTRGRFLDAKYSADDIDSGAYRVDASDRLCLDDETLALSLTAGKHRFQSLDCVDDLGETLNDVADTSPFTEVTYLLRHPVGSMGVKESFMDVINGLPKRGNETAQARRSTPLPREATALKAAGYAYRLVCLKAV